MERIQRADSLMSIKQDAREKELPTQLDAVNARRRMKESLEKLEPSINAGNAIYELREEGAFGDKDKFLGICKRGNCKPEDILVILEKELKRVGEGTQALIAKAEAGTARQGDDNSYKRHCLFEEQLFNEIDFIKKVIENKS